MPETATISLYMMAAIYVVAGIFHFVTPKLFLNSRNYRNCIGNRRIVWSHTFVCSYGHYCFVDCCVSRQLEILSNSKTQKKADANHNCSPPIAYASRLDLLGVYVCVELSIKESYPKRDSVSFFNRW